MWAKNEAFSARWLYSGSFSLSFLTQGGRAGKSNNHAPHVYSKKNAIPSLTVCWTLHAVCASTSHFPTTILHHPAIIPPCHLWILQAWRFYTWNIPFIVNDADKLLVCVCVVSNVNENTMSCFRASVDVINKKKTTWLCHVFYCCYIY